MYETHFTLGLFTRTSYVVTYLVLKYGWEWANARYRISFIYRQHDRSLASVTAAAEKYAADMNYVIGRS